jgi:hypothetical protein
MIHMTKTMERNTNTGSLCLLVTINHLTINEAVF